MGCLTCRVPEGFDEAREEDTYGAHPGADAGLYEGKSPCLGILQSDPNLTGDNLGADGVVRCKRCQLKNMSRKDGLTGSSLACYLDLLCSEKPMLASFQLVWKARETNPRKHTDTHGHGTLNDE